MGENQLNTDMRPFVSVVLPIYNEERFIEKCIQSILAQDYPKERLQLIFVDGMSQDRTRDIVHEYSKKYPFIQLIDNPKRVVPYALNKGIKASKGEVIIRLDGHCDYPSNYISVLVKYLYELGADNVGGVWRTLPAHPTNECYAIAIASSHPFGVGGSEHKVGSKEIKETDTVPFGCYRREVFERIGYFDEELTRNQDDEFNARLINNGGHIYIIPELVINYTARDSMHKMRRMYYQYGLFKPLANKKLGAPATVRQFFPGLFVLGLIGGGILSCFSKAILAIYLAVIALYLLIGLAIGFSKASEYRRPALVLLMPYTFACIHISYGVGYLNGMLKVLFNKPFNVNCNR